MVISSFRLRKGQVQLLRVREVVSDGMGLMDFMFWPENSVLNVPNGQEKPVEGTVKSQKYWKTNVYIPNQFMGIESCISYWSKWNFYSYY